MSRRREALAYRFIAHVLTDTQSWPPELQVSLYELAMSTLPEVVLELDENGARDWAKQWRADLEATVNEPLHPIHDDSRAWIEQMASEWLAARRGSNEPATPAQLQRLASLYTRFGSLALALPWRGEPIGHA